VTYIFAFLSSINTTLRSSISVSIESPSRSFIRAELFTISSPDATPCPETSAT
jgi:hypothetical protein